MDMIKIAKDVLIQTIKDIYAEKRAPEHLPDFTHCYHFTMF